MSNEQTLQSVTLAIQALREKAHQEELRHAREIGLIRHQIREQEFTLSCLSSGLDPDRIAAGKEIVDVTGDPTTAERAQVVSDACEDLAAGGSKLAVRYMGTKDYARWTDQREDHEYGRAPRHGNIRFSVGLRRPFRGELSPDQIDAALYYLQNLSLLSGIDQGTT